MNKINGKTIEEWCNKYSILKNLIEYKEVDWYNPNYNNTKAALKSFSFDISDMIDAESRLLRFAPFLKTVFAEVEKSNGIIESPLVPIENMRDALNIKGNVLLKCDNYLPISGSIKARGGIYEILRYAEKILFENSILNINDDYSILADDKIKRFLNKYEIVVSSTGNLGLSIGIISAKLGFKVYVHMSMDAQQWKKDKLRDIGVNVIEHDSDYSKAVEIGRMESDKKDNSYFVDDENSINLFMGYSVAAFRIKSQLENMNLNISSTNKLFVYLPCGVGGGPGGIAYGLKELFGDNVHCFFVEPTHSPCMLLGMSTNEHNRVCVQDFAIDNITIADGLAVGRASKFVGKVMSELLAGIITVDDQKLFYYLKLLVDTEKIYLEPSALAGFKGLESLFNLDTPLYNNVIIKPKEIKNGTHIVWSTGGNMVPKDVMKKYYEHNNN